MYKLVVILIFIFGCQPITGEVTKVKSSKEDVILNVVQKNLEINSVLPQEMTFLIENWFNNNLKVNGFEGNVLIKINSYNQKLSNIELGKKIEITANISMIIYSEGLTKRNIYSFDLNEYSTISGDFSLKDVDTMILNTQTNLVNRLSSKLNSKI